METVLAVVEMVEGGSVESPVQSCILAVLGWQLYFCGLEVLKNGSQARNQDTV
jgi:hypothetical protein